MRISLLRKREPFADIVAATLRRFWTYQYDQELDVTWSGTPDADHRRAQVWLCNDYLNCIFLPNTPRAAFGPIRREFARSIQPWRTPLQRGYVSWATNPLTSRLFAHQRLHVRPAIPDHPEQLVVPGNTKIRVISASQAATWVLLKEGFAAADFHREIENRQRAARAGVPVPGIQEIDADRAWLCEQFVEGTPVNRLSGGQLANQVTQRGYMAILPLVESTLESILSAEYADELQTRFHGILPRLDCVADETKQRLAGAADELLRRSRATDHQVECSQTHGDFQPGNILLDRDAVWIIDWEYAGRRLAVYDPLVMGLASRFSAGLADRLLGFTKHGFKPNGGVWPSTWPIDFGNSLAERSQLATFFLLEELILHVRENAKPPITSAGHGLHEMLRQAERFLEITATS